MPPPRSTRDQMLDLAREMPTRELYDTLLRLHDKRIHTPADGLAFAVAASAICERYDIDAQATAMHPAGAMPALTAALVTAGWTFD